MDGGVGEPERLFVETEAWDSFIPELRQRDTVCPGTGDGPGTVEAEKSNEDPTCQAHPGRGEDSLELEKD